MSALEPHHRVLLENAIESEFLQHLPPLLDTTKSPEQQQRKNFSRAFSAFALHHLLGISPMDASKAVVDDFDDYGIDAIYYHAPTETLYLVQSKLKAAEQFSLDEALAYCQGVRKLIKQDFSGFNQNVQNRMMEIEDALDECANILLVIAHTGWGISKHAKQAIDELLADEDHGEERLNQQVVDYDAQRVVDNLREGKAYERVDTDLSVYKCASVSEPRITYFGLVQLQDLVKLHDKYDKALYEKNIRTFLGHKTEVNTSIQQTLATNPQDFLFLNNGVTALCEQIDAKSTKQGRKKLKLRGFSVINGAQTIAASANFRANNKDTDISSARVSVTIIKAKSDGDFGKSVTRARNHQNPVLLANFAALDDEQERLRRELAYLSIHYAYKAETSENGINPSRISIDEAVQALALLYGDPRYAVWLKKEPTRFFDTGSDQYKSLFSPRLTAFQLVNAVRLNRYIQRRVVTEVSGASGQERLAYKHGNYALAWVFAKRIRSAIDSAALIDQTRLETNLSAPFDQLRQTHWDKTRVATRVKGPLAIFRNQTDLVPLLELIASDHYGLSTDPVLNYKRQQQHRGEPFPEALFEYLVSKAPQITNLT
jgi:hypothetical protein